MTNYGFMKSGTSVRYVPKPETVQPTVAPSVPPQTRPPSIIGQIIHGTQRPNQSAAAPASSFGSPSPMATQAYSSNLLSGGGGLLANYATAGPYPFTMTDFPYDTDLSKVPWLDKSKLPTINEYSYFPN